MSNAPANSNTSWWCRATILNHDYNLRLSAYAESPFSIQHVSVRCLLLAIIITLDEMQIRGGLFECGMWQSHLVADCLALQEIRQEVGTTSAYLILGKTDWGLGVLTSHMFVQESG